MTRRTRIFFSFHGARKLELLITVLVTAYSVTTAHRVTKHHNTTQNSTANRLVATTLTRGVVRRCTASQVYHKCGHTPGPHDSLMRVFMMTNCVHGYTHMHAFTHAHTHTHTYIYIYIHTHTHTHTHTHAHTYARNIIELYYPPTLHVYIDGRFKDKLSHYGTTIFESWTAERTNQRHRLSRPSAIGRRPSRPSAVGRRP